MPHGEEVRFFVALLATTIGNQAADVFCLRAIVWIVYIYIYIKGGDHCFCHNPQVKAITILGLTSSPMMIERYKNMRVPPYHAFYFWMTSALSLRP